MNVALKENEVIKFEESQEQYAAMQQENYILLSMAQAQFVKESEQFATLIQDSFSRQLGLRNRGVDQAGFFVLIGASMPSVLIESAFISNAKEEALLMTPSFRQKMAESICDAVDEFISIQEN